MTAFITKLTEPGPEEKPHGSVVPMPPVTKPEDVYYRYSDMVYRLALARCRNKSDAEDVMQDVFVRYVRANPTFESAEHQRAWLIKTAVNCSNSRLKSAWRCRTSAFTDELLNGSVNPPSDAACDVYAAVLRLPIDQRTAVHLFYYEGYKVSEIASLTGTTESTVKSRLRRARIKLEDELKGEYFDV